jgi:ribulose-bisphosphate carboxylase large chain
LTKSKIGLLAEIAGHKLSGERIRALYRFRCHADQVQELAEFLCHEHSLELSASVLPDGFLKHNIVGRVDHLEIEPDGTSICWVSYAAELASGGFTTLLNLLMGNAGFVATVELIDMELPASILNELVGPRFGIAGIRKLVGVAQGPIGATALKPLGASSRELAAIAFQMALGGLDIIKEDDGISTQVFAPFEDRVERCAGAIAEASAKTGKHTLYFPNITGPIEKLVERAMFAKRAGASGVEILPGMTSLDSIRMIAQLPDFGLPIMAHCSWQGALCRPPNAAISMAVVFGLLPRLGGVDLSITTSFGGRFDLPRASCDATAQALKRPIAGIAPALPMPGGGITPHGLDSVLEVFGSSTVLLVSGALFQGLDMTAACSDYMQMVRESAKTAKTDIA